MGNTQRYRSRIVRVPFVVQTLYVNFNTDLKLPALY